MKEKYLTISGAVFGALAVITGAFGAHALRELLDERSLANWETASRYQFYHALALLLTGLLASKPELRGAGKAGILFITGILLFSGSLYLLSLRSLISLDLTWLGPVTPLGGLCFILGWVRLAWSAGKIPQ